MRGQKWNIKKLFKGALNAEPEITLLNGSYGDYFRTAKSHVIFPGHLLYRLTSFTSTSFRE